METHANAPSASVVAPRAEGGVPLGLGVAALVCAVCQVLLVPWIIGLCSALPAVAAFGGAVAWLVGGRGSITLARRGRLVALAGFALIGLPLLVIGGVESLWADAGWASVGGLFAAAAGVWLDTRGPGLGGVALGRLLLTVLVIVVVGALAWAAFLVLVLLLAGGSG